MLKQTFLKGSCAIRALAFAGAMLAPAMGNAGEVTLKSSDGSVNLVGEFLTFEENTYVIRTALGELRISAARVRCEGDSCPVFETTQADVIIAGSDTVGLGVMPLLLQGYAGYLDAEAIVTATSNESELLAELIGEQGFGDPVGKYLVSSTASGDAFKKLLDGSTEIGMASRRIKPAEARSLRDAGAGNMISPQQEHIVAVDSLVVITHPNNPVSQLTTAQLADIFAGRITNWSEVGGEDAPITLMDRQDGSGTRSVFAKAVFGNDGPDQLPSAIVQTDNNAMAAAVNADPHAIGYVSYAFQRGAKAVPLVNECGITMVPDAFSARTEEYALQRRLYLYNRGDKLSETSQSFLDYALSADADGVIAKSGFIGLGIARRPMPLDGARARSLLDPNADAFEGGVMREMLGTMVDYDRLSTTFRFNTGSSRLDERARLDMARLVDYLGSQPEGTQVTLVGFTDNVGAFASNRDLSERRAVQVLQELQNASGGALANIELAAAGYGEVAPSACNTAETGRRINRRVEVWINSPDA